MNRRNFINNILVAGASFSILPGDGRIWKAVASPMVKTQVIGLRKKNGVTWTILKGTQNQTELIFQQADGTITSRVDLQTFFDGYNPERDRITVVYKDGDIKVIGPFPSTHEKS